VRDSKQYQWCEVGKCRGVFRTVSADPDGKAAACCCAMLFTGSGETSRSASESIGLQKGGLRSRCPAHIRSRPPALTAAFHTPHRRVRSRRDQCEGWSVGTFSFSAATSRTAENYPHREIEKAPGVGAVRGLEAAIDRRLGVIGGRSSIILTRQIPTLS
jgi:hypothetical protein